MSRRFHLLRLAVLAACALGGCSTDDPSKPRTLEELRRSVFDLPRDGRTPAGESARAADDGRPTPADAGRANPADAPAARSAGPSQRSNPGPALTGKTDSTAPAARIESAQSAGRRVLLINDEVLTVDDVLQPIRARLTEAAERYPTGEYHRAMRELIRGQLVTEVSERLVCRKAERELDEEKNKRLDEAVKRLESERIQREFGGRTARYEAWLEAEGITRDQLCQRLRRRLMVQQYVHERLISRATLTRRDLMDYYQTHPAEFRKTARVEMWHIDIPLRELLAGRDYESPDKIAAARRIARQRLEEARTKIQGGMPFAEAARQYSLGIDADKGGCWGFVSQPLDGYFKEMSRVVLGLSAGQLSDVQETPECVFLVKAGAVEGEEVTSFQDAQPRIAERVRQQRLSELESEFLQKLLDQSVLGNLEPFVQAVAAAAPESKWLGSNVARAKTK